MSEPDRESSDRNEATAVKRTPQLTLARLMSVIALVCVGVAWWQLRVRNQELEVRLAALRKLAPSLQVNDSSDYAAVMLLQDWYDDAKWDVYLPPGSEYRICLATDDVVNDPFHLPPSIAAEKVVSAGQYQFELKSDIQDEASSVQVLVDGEIILNYKEPSDWNPQGMSSGGALRPLPMQQTTRKPLTLYQRRFRPSNKPLNKNDAVKGIMLWIEALD